MPYKAKGQCVYKADSGKKVGCTKGPVKKYLAALHTNVPDSKNENDGQVCDTCDGKGWYVVGDTNNPEQKQCDACEGTGRKLVNEQDSQDIKVDITDIDVSITRVANGIPSKSTYHLGHRATPEEADALKQSTLEADKTFASRFRSRFGLTEQRTKLREVIKKTIRDVRRENRLTK